jgi:hypothetical protein
MPPSRRRALAQPTMRRNTHSVRVLEVLYGALVLFGLFSRAERTQVLALPGLQIEFAGIKTIFAVFQFSDHNFGGARTVP